MSVEDCDYVEAELMRDGYRSDRIADPPTVMDEIVRRANDALSHPDRGCSREETMANARLAAEETRRRRS
jgi:hypothetical protein